MPSASRMADNLPKLGVVVVTFNSADVIEGCLASLKDAGDAIAKIVIIDNASQDETAATVRNCIDADHCAERIELVEERVNSGYAGGVNRGLELLLAERGIDLFWVLNPDCRFDPETPRYLRKAAALGPFSLMGGRTVYDDRPYMVQTDGGKVSRLTGRCRSINAGLPLAQAPVPDAADLDFVSGASCVASRRFVETIGPMRDDYFLYYEEVDWAFRRGDLPLRFVPEAIVRHIGGTAIGSGSRDRRASPFSNYFNYRSRMLFLSRFMPSRLPAGAAFALAKAGHLGLKGHRREAAAIIAGTLGRSPPRDVREWLDRWTTKLIRRNAAPSRVTATEY